MHLQKNSSFFYKHNKSCPIVIHTTTQKVGNNFTHSAARKYAMEMQMLLVKTNLQALLSMLLKTKQIIKDRQRQKVRDKERERGKMQNLIAFIVLKKKMKLRKRIMKYCIFVSLINVC